MPTGCSPNAVDSVFYYSQGRMCMCNSGTVYNLSIYSTSSSFLSKNIRFKKCVFNSVYIIWPTNACTWMCLSHTIHH
jgi:hypothetical protein